MGSRRLQTPSEVALDPSIVKFQFPAPHPLLRTALLIQVGTFDITGFEFIPDAAFEYNDPDLTIEINFPIAMDETVTPATTDFIIEIDDTPVTPDSVVWDEPEVLILNYAEAGHGTPVIDLEFLGPVPNLRCLSLRQACPFELFELPDL